VAASSWHCSAFDSWRVTIMSQPTDSSRDLHFEPTRQLRRQFRRRGRCPLARRRCLPVPWPVPTGVSISRGKDRGECATIRLERYQNLNKTLALKPIGFRRTRQRMKQTWKWALQRDAGINDDPDGSLQMIKAGSYLVIGATCADVFRVSRYSLDARRRGRRPDLCARPIRRAIPPRRSQPDYRHVPW
jgi:hypothetical protein